MVTTLKQATAGALGQAVPEDPTVPELPAEPDPSAPTDQIPYYVGAPPNAPSAPPNPYGQPLRFSDPTGRYQFVIHSATKYSPALGFRFDKATGGTQALTPEEVASFHIGSPDDPSGALAGATRASSGLAAQSAANRLAFDQQRAGVTDARQARLDAQTAATNAANAQNAIATRQQAARGQDWSIVQAAQQGRISVAQAMERLAALRQQEQADPFKFGQYLQHLANLPQGTGNPLQSLIGSGVRIAPDTSGVDSIQGILQKVLDEYNQIPTFGNAERARSALENPATSDAAKTFLSQRPEDLQRMFGGGAAPAAPAAAPAYGFGTPQAAQDFASQTKNATPEQLGALQQMATAQAGTPAAHAHGGNMTTTGPAVLIDVKSGKSLGLMGEAGPERLTIMPLQHRTAHMTDPSPGMSAGEHSHPAPESTPEGALQQMMAGRGIGSGVHRFAEGGTFTIGGFSGVGANNIYDQGKASDPASGYQGGGVPNVRGAQMQVMADRASGATTPANVAYQADPYGLNVGPDGATTSGGSYLTAADKAFYDAQMGVPANATAQPRTADETAAMGRAGLSSTGGAPPSASTAPAGAVAATAAQQITPIGTPTPAPAPAPATVAQTAAPAPAAAWAPPANAISQRYTHDQYMWMAVASGVPAAQAEQNYATDKYLVEGARQDAAHAAAQPRQAAPATVAQTAQPTGTTIPLASAQAIALGKALRPLGFATPEMLSYLDRGEAPPPGTVTDKFMAKLPPALQKLLEAVIKAFGISPTPADYEHARKQFAVPGVQLHVANR